MKESAEIIGSFRAEVSTGAYHLADECLPEARDNLTRLPLRAELKDPFDDDIPVLLRIQRRLIPEQLFTGNKYILKKITHNQPASIHPVLRRRRYLILQRPIVCQNI